MPLDRKEVGNYRRMLARDFNDGWFDGFWRKPASPPADPGRAEAYNRGYRTGSNERQSGGP